jgi:hypothetical protein
MCDNYCVSTNFVNVMWTERNTSELVLAGITLIGVDGRKPWQVTRFTLILVGHGITSSRMNELGKLE